MHASLSVGHFFKNQKGSALISITLSIIALVGMVSMVIVSQNQNKLKTMKQINVGNVADQIKQKVLAAVLSPQAWQITQTKNTSAFAALVGGGAHSSAIDLYLDSTSTPFYSSSVQNMGFDQSGQVCDSFNSRDGNDGCPFRYKIYVIGVEVINGNNVHNVKFDFEFKPKSNNILLNAKKTDYSFTVKRNINARSVEATCISLSGSLNSGSSECTVNFRQEHNCVSQAKAYTGLGSVSGEHCKTVRIAARSCPSGRVLKGFSSGGSAICEVPYN